MGGIKLLCDYLYRLISKSNDPSVIEYLVELTVKYDPSEAISETLENEVRRSSSVRALLGIVSLWKLNTKDGSIQRYELLEQVLEQYIKTQFAFQCHHCGYQVSDFLWRCPACHYWDTIE